MLTPEMTEQPVAAVPVMNAQPAPGYAEPVPEPTAPTVPETIQPEVSTEPVSEVTQPEASARSAAASFCENCGNALVQDAIFCPNCGHRVNTAPTAVCTGCGAKLPDGAAFCTACGKRSGT